MRVSGIIHKTTALRLIKPSTKVMSKLEHRLSLITRAYITHSTKPAANLPSGLLSMSHEGHLLGLFYDVSRAILCVKIGNDWHEVYLCYLELDA